MSRGVLLSLAAVAALTSFAYAPALRAPRVYDDALLSRLSPPSLLNPPPAVPAGVPLPVYAWRPLTEASLLVCPGREGNLLLHLAASSAVFLLVGMLEPVLAPWAVAFFALHPMGAQAAAYLYQRAVLLEACLAFLTLLLYLRARDSGSRISYAGALVAALLATAAKETGATVPLLLGVVEILRPKPGALRRWLPFTLPALVVLVQVLRSAAGGWGWSPRDYLLLEIPIVVGYLRLAFLPFPLHFLYDRRMPVEGQAALIPWAQTLACGALLVLGAVWVLAGPRRQFLPRLGLGLFLGSLALESSVFPLVDLGFHHRAYPGLLGAALLFAWTVRRLARPGLWGGALALAFLAQGLMAEARSWSDPPRLLRRDVRSAWHLDAAWASAGWRALETGRPARALPLYRRALASPRRGARTLAGAARALADLGRLEEARRLSDFAMETFPAHVFPLWIAVDVAERERDLDRLRRLADRAEGFPCLHPMLSRWLATWRLREGRRAEADRVIERALALFPRDPALRELQASLGKGGP